MPATKNRRARVIATAVEIWCPDAEGCGRADPIPAANGSFMWTHLPLVVTCPDCGGTFKVGAKVEF